MIKIKSGLISIIFIMSFAVSASQLLLTEDYGIVSQKDIEREEQSCNPGPITKAYTACNYWQCFPLNDNYKIYCTARDKNITAKARQNYEPVGYVILSIHHQGKFYEFSSKRNYDYEYCNELAEIWQNVFKNEPVGCIAASFLDNIRPNRHSNVISSAWEVSGLKSQSRHWDHFVSQGPD